MDIDALSAQVTGPVFRPGDPGYDDERLGYQRAHAHRPAVIVGATGPDDVVAAVRAAAAAGERIAVQATGHGLAAPLESGLLVSTRRMDQVTVDPVARTARIAAGVRAGALLAATAPHGLAPMLGSSPSVGVVSYTLGGGIGLFARRHGYAADHVVALEVVTADGVRRRASATEEPELFRSLRGGGGNLGVVVAMEIALQPVERFYGGGLFVDVAAVPDVLERWRAWTEGVSENVTSAVAVLPFPDVDGVPPPLRGRHAAQIQVVHLGSDAEAERDLAPLRALPLLADTAAEHPVGDLGSAFAEPDEPHAYRGPNVGVSRLDAGGLATLTERAGPGSGLMNVVGLRHLGGALARPAPSPSAVGLRGAAYSVGVLSVVEPGQEALADGIAAAALAPFADAVVGRSLNFTYGPLAPAAVRDGYTVEDAERIAALRARFDPHGLLAPNFPVTPVPTPAA